MYQIKNLSQYLKQYAKSVGKPEKFWGKLAAKHFEWQEMWDQVLDYDMEQARISWFLNGKLNIVTNCIDRHLRERGEKNAIIFEPNNPLEAPQFITYKALHERVCKMANVLLMQGIKKGDRVCIYLPMIPELAISVLACARIGAVHSVVFAGFSANALATRITDCGAKMVITSDGGFRGAKILDLKSIVDEAVAASNVVESVLVVKRTQQEVNMINGRDFWLQSLLDEASGIHCAEIMDAEEPLFILYTSGSTGKPKGMLHTIGGYMVYTGYTFKNIFDYQESDVYWCTADIGWITGHSYIIYGPLLNGATTVMFEGIPSYPDHSRFWEVIEKHRVTQFYTAPTAIRALAKEDLSFVTRFSFNSLRVIGTVGEPINEEAWHWYQQHVGCGRCPVVDTWWQTETGGIMMSPIPFVTPTKPTFATLPLPGVQPVLVDDKGVVIEAQHQVGNLCIAFPWPSIARTIWGDHERYRQTYFLPFPGKYFTGDGALRDEVGYYRITGRVDDVVIVSGHNLGTAPIEDAINEHQYVAESAVVGYPHEIKGEALYGFVILKDIGHEVSAQRLKEEINELVVRHIGPIAKLDKIQLVEGLPKTRSGKIMRRILRKIAAGDQDDFGDVSTLLNPEIVQAIKAQSI